MFVLIPLELKPDRKLSGLPIANGALIAINVLFYLLSVLFGWYWTVGPGTGFLSTLLYGFSHANFWHLLFNMWALWVFGNAVNQRLGNGYYLLAYLGVIVFIGCVAWFCFLGPVLGASGGVFAVIIIAAMLLPAARLKMAYGAIFPLSVLIGLIRRPEHGIFWFICGGQFQVRAFWSLLFIPVLEICSLLCGLISGQGGVWHLGHLLGAFCGVAVVLCLPTRISMPNRSFA